LALLIADSGASKTDWLLQDADAARRLTTAGLNPNTTGEAAIRETLQRQVRPWLSGARVGELYFFGAGLGRPESRSQMADLLRADLAPIARLRVQSDLVGAGWACLGGGAGLVGILGTGSVAFRFDGNAVVARRGGWGYLLGDEGSGTDLGRNLLRLVLSRQLPPDLLEDYCRTFSLAPEDLPDVVHRHENPSAFLAAQVPFVAAHRDAAPVREMIRQRFERYLEGSLMPLVAERDEPIGLTGGLVRTFGDLLERLCRERGLSGVRLQTRAPIEAIAGYLRVSAFS